MKLIPRYLNEVPRYDGGGWLEKILPGYLVHRFSSKVVSSDPHDKYKGDNPTSEYVDGTTGAAAKGKPKPIDEKTRKKIDQEYQKYKTEYLEKDKTLSAKQLLEAINWIDNQYGLDIYDYNKINEASYLNQASARRAALVELLDIALRSALLPGDTGPLTGYIDLEKYNALRGWLGRQWDSYTGTAYNDPRGWLHPKYYLPALGALSIAPLSSTAAEASAVTASAQAEAAALELALALGTATPAEIAEATAALEAAKASQTAAYAFTEKLGLGSGSWLTAHPYISTATGATLVNAAGPGLNMYNKINLNSESGDLYVPLDLPQVLELLEEEKKEEEKEDKKNTTTTYTTSGDTSGGYTGGGTTTTTQTSTTLPTATLTTPLAALLATTMGLVPRLLPRPSATESSEISLQELDSKKSSYNPEVSTNSALTAYLLLNLNALLSKYKGVLPFIDYTK